MGGHISSGRKDPETTAGNYLWIIGAWLLLTAIIAVISSAIFWQRGRNDVAELRAELAIEQNQIHDLTDQLSPFQSYADKAYPGDKRAALAQLAKEVGRLDDLKSMFRPLDAPSRKKVISKLRAEFGTSRILFELIAEPGNTNRDLLVDEIKSTLKEAGLDAFVGTPHAGTFSGSQPAIQFGYGRGEERLEWSFVYPMLDDFMVANTVGGTNAPQTGKLTVHVFGDPLFSADGHVTFKGDPARDPSSLSTHGASRALATRGN